MFKKTLNLSQLKREINDLLGDLTGDDAYKSFIAASKSKLLSLRSVTSNSSVN